ncbi:DUF3626 domain-containing protein [Paenisporosarcina quisquiliarum]|uniref:DUF3626 domain-containing protein n=1 Tax=Paenisporosarcina quisquiliarum TaxID=365346 RepID=A0A9X3LIF3_9BACL|nr:DUF3626 domain-containing protein [Paenisporosarcina quisquiliarum]MCZ8537606.1 DUF3626 domain-containing protein [Paenisporosarcina quisquiliarum]
MELSRPQLLALENITNYARNHRHDANETINHILRMSNISDELFNNAVDKLKAHARIGLHFHPDRPNSTMKMVAESLLEQGVYKSQFETFISNGSVSAYPGGERDLWEKRIFGGAYQLDGTTNNQRPKYGALNLMLHPDGPAPRFGSCYFLLSPNASYRSTYTYLDSHQDPKEKGTYKEFDLILVALLEETFLRDFAIGERNLTPARLINHLLINIEKPFTDPTNKEPNRNLNHYIEAQVHGDISLKEDVEVLVADSSFKKTYVGGILEQICHKYSIDLYWHKGFALTVDEVPSDFRGPSMPSLAKRIAQNNVIDAKTIGLAVMELNRNPETWIDYGSYNEVLQELKLLWHVLVRYGK